MGAALNVYFVYEYEHNKCLIIKLIQDSFSNSFESEYTEAMDKLYKKRDELLGSVFGTRLEDVYYLGEFQGSPEGDIWHSKKGCIEISNIFISIYLPQPTFLFFEQAPSELEFQKKLDVYCQEESLDSTSFKKPYRFFSYGRFVSGV